MSEEPEQIVAKIVRWGIRYGAENSKYGKFLTPTGGGKSQGNNNGPTGKKATRWYPDRAWKKKGGKHWAKKSQAVKQAAANLKALKGK